MTSTTTYLLDGRVATDHFPGIGRYVSNLARAVVSHLHPNESLAILTNPTAASRWELPPPDHVRVRHLPTPISPFSPAQQWLLPARIRHSGAAVYHAPYYLMPYFSRRPTALTCYDLIPLVLPETNSHHTQRLFSLFHRLALWRSHHIIAISEATQHDLHAHFGLPAAKTTVIPLAPDPQFRPQSNVALSAIRQKYDLPTQFSLYVGINKPHKNLVRLVQAWAMLPSRPKLIIAGRWDERYPEVKAEIGRLQLSKQVRLLGPIAESDLPALYAAATLFIFPSLYEGFGLPIIEAMACGTPVACSYSASLPEVGGLAAAYFNPADVKDIARTLEWVIDSPERLAEMHTLSLQQAATFSWAHTAQQTINLYRQLALMD